MNAFLRWWYNVTLPAPRKVAANHVTSDFLMGCSEQEMKRLCDKRAKEMLASGVNAPWLARYVVECNRIAASLASRA